MTPFPARHVAAIQALLGVWDPRQFIVIGAAAIARHMDFRWRGTIDLDLSVASGLDACARDLESLGWRREHGAPQRWVVPPDGFYVDVLPSPAPLVSQGGFTWPDGGAHMSLVGFRLAFADAMPIEIPPGSSVRVASLRSIVVLKIAAYFDRPRERDSDLADIAHIMSGYVGYAADARWSDEVLALGLEFEDVSSFVLGKELGALVDPSERRLLRRFLATIENAEDPLSTMNRMAERAPSSWRDPARLSLRLSAFRRGLEATASEASP